MAYSCGQCGQRVTFPGLCSSCSSKREEVIDNSRRAAEAAEAQLAAQRSAELERQLDQARLERQQHANYIVDIANRIDDLLPSKGTTLKQAWGTLARLSGINGDLAKWKSMLACDRHGIEFAYPTLRQRIVPYIVRLSQTRDQSIPQSLLKDYAVTFLYSDLARALEVDAEVRSLQDQYDDATSSVTYLSEHGKKQRDAGIGCLCLGALATFAMPLALNVGATPTIVTALICLLLSALYWSQSTKAQRAVMDCRKKAPRVEKLLREGQQQSPRVAVGGDRLGTGVALGDQPLGEERLKRRGEQAHERTSSGFW